MTMISKLKKDWKQGRDWVSSSKQTRKNFDDADDTLRLLESELGTDIDNERRERYYNEAIKPSKEYDNKYNSRGSGLINTIAESLPRKKHKKSTKVKRKCRCK
jgi:hypothetical protein